MLKTGALIIASSDFREENGDNEDIPAFTKETQENFLQCQGSAVPVCRGTEGYPGIYASGEQKEKDRCRCNGYIIKGEQMKMKRKMIAVIIASALSVSMLSGCSSKGTEDAAAVPAEAEEPSDESSGSGEAEGAKTPAETESPSEEAVTLNVFAAASMTETLEKIQTMYADVAPEVTLVFNFDSSGTLKTQIQEGADCDVFISAAQKQMNQLDITADPEVNEDGLDFVLEGSRINLLENKVVLAVPEGNPAGIESFQDLGTDRLKLLALGNEDVPVGQYSTEILTNLGLLEGLEADGKITYGSNVKEVTTQVSEASADAGIIYATDAFSAGLTTVDEAGTDLCRQVVYPAAVLKTSQAPEASQAFLDYLQTEECMKVFGEVGFSRAP